jgi:hypothetical protein
MKGAKQISKFLSFSLGVGDLFLLTVRLLPIDGGACIRGRGGKYDLAAYAVPIGRRYRGVVDGPQYGVDEHV